MTPSRNVPEHFYTLDAIRGIASIVVVLYHWQLFYYLNDVFVLGGFNKADLPLYPYLSLLYDDGVVVVDLFFLLSGFIFFWLYADRVASRKISFPKFMGYRLTRLFPIHLVTLAAAGILQFFIWKALGHYFIIEYNDGYHFILNLLFMQSWGIEKGPSFNGPSWSVSVEACLYLLFFLLCYFRLHQKKLLLLLLIPVGVFLQYYFSLVGKGMYSFFLGGLVYYAYTWMVEQDKVKQYFTPLLTVTLLLWMFILLEYRFSFVQTAWVSIMHQVRPAASHQYVSAGFGLLSNFFFRTAVSPFTILTLALWETRGGSISKKWAVPGNCSYAIYLLHFPLQMIFVLAVYGMGLDRMVLRSPYALLLFFLILLPASYFTYYRFELPSQEKLRSRFFRSKKKLVPVVEVKMVP